MRDPDDYRSHLLPLTARALPIIEYVRHLSRAIHDNRELGLSETEARQLLMLLRRLHANFSERHVETSHPS
jgi:DNA-binding MarR family transcriptional regulator